MDHKRRGSGLSHHSFVRYNRKTTSRFGRFPSPRWLCHVSTVTQNSCRVVGENDKIRCHQVSSEGSPDLCRYRGNPTDRFAASKLGSAVVQALFYKTHKSRRWNENPAMESDTDHLPGGQHKPEPITTSVVKGPSLGREEDRSGGAAVDTINMPFPSDGSLFS